MSKQKPVKLVPKTGASDEEVERIRRHNEPTAAVVERPKGKKRTWIFPPRRKVPVEPAP